jgi:hypothetical protein
MQVPPRLASRLHNVFGQNLGLPQLVFKSRQAVLDTVQVPPPPCTAADAQLGPGLPMRAPYQGIPFNPCFRG